MDCKMSPTVMLRLFSACTSMPWESITITGLPLMTVCIFLFLESSKIAWWMTNIVKIATIPKVMGMDLSAMGMHASSEMTSVMTSSNGSISPIWRLPISRIVKSSTAKSMIALKNTIIIPLVWRKIAKLFKQICVGKILCQADVLLVNNMQNLANSKQK